MASNILIVGRNILFVIIIKFRVRRLVVQLPQDSEPIKVFCCLIPRYLVAPATFQISEALLSWFLHFLLLFLFIYSLLKYTKLGSLDSKFKYCHTEETGRRKKQLKGKQVFAPSLQPSHKA